MNSSAVRRIFLALAVVVLPACSAEGPLAPGSDAPLFDVVVDPTTTIHVAVCKVGLDAATVGQSFDFEVQATGGGDVLIPTPSLLAVAPANERTQCKLVWGHEGVSYDSDSEVTITELVPPGYTLESVSVYHFGTYTNLPVNNGSVTVVPEGGWKYVIFHNREEQPVVPGRMTGGGHQLRVDGARVTRGLTLHCDVTLSNNLEINWPGGNKWHLEKESLDSISCIDDPAYEPFPPAAPFDTFIATATGSLNGVDGAIIDFKFIDDGEPGRTDEAYITIYEPNLGPGQVAPGSEVVALQVGGQLDGGNLQAHYDQPHK